MSSTVTGAQRVDSTGRTLDAAIPPHLSTNANRDLNPTTHTYVYVWLYRVNHRNVDSFITVGQYARESVS